MTEPTSASLYNRLRAECLAVGFDLVQPAQVGWYNQAVDRIYQLPDFGSPESLAVVIGNTRALWPHFVQAIRDDAGLAAASHPLDRYTERSIGDAAAKLDSPHELRFSHELPPRRVAMQRLAHVSGLAYLSPSYLSVHQTFGPWIALRAVVVLAVPGPDSPMPHWQAPCQCALHCEARFHQACAASSRLGSTQSQLGPDNWRAWLAVRDACPVGRMHRYSEEQIEYHYTKNHGVLSITAPGSRRT